MQFVDQKDDLEFNFYFKGNTINSAIYTATQFKHKKHMAPPKKINFAKSVLSPMPGAIVNVSVEKGQTVIDGQELLCIEAMKM